MVEINNKFEDYFSHLQKITFLGRVYKKLYSSPILFFYARRFGRRIVEIGSGTGNGVLGAFSKSVHGLEINPLAVKYCQSVGLRVDLISPDGLFPVSDGTFDVCVLDNVLEHIEEPKKTLDECYRVTKNNGCLLYTSSPYVWSILGGENQITVSLIEASDPVDSGAIWLKTTFDLEGHELLPEIYAKLFEAELLLMSQAVDQFDCITPMQQLGESGPYMKRRTPADSRLDPGLSLIHICYKQLWVSVKCNG